MPVFRYQALSAQGQSRQGRLQADSARAARQLLRAQGLVPLQVQSLQDEAGGQADAAALPWWRRPIGPPRRRLSASARVLWLRQLGSLLDNGLPLDRAFVAMRAQAQQAAQADMLALIRADVSGGSGLAQALGQFPREFPAAERAAIAAAEQGGQLGAVLLQLAEGLHAMQQLRQKVLSAALYPAIVSLVALAVAVFLLTTVVPPIAQVFAGSQRELPTLTVLMLALSRGLRDWAPLCLGLVLVAPLLWRLAMRRTPWRLRVSALWLRLPVIGPLARAYQTARLCQTLGMLVQAGVPLLKALQTATATVGSPYLQQQLQTLMAEVREGAPLGLALERQTELHPLMATFARVGEETGRLPAMLLQVSQQLAAEVQRRAMLLATLLEPALILLMGGMVLLIVLAVLTPIMELNTLVRL